LSAATIPRIQAVGKSVVVELRPDYPYFNLAILELKK